MGGAEGAGGMGGEVDALEAEVRDLGLDAPAGAERAWALVVVSIVDSTVALT